MFLQNCARRNLAWEHLRTDEIEQRNVRFRDIMLVHIMPIYKLFFEENVVLELILYLKVKVSNLEKDEQ